MLSKHQIKKQYRIHTVHLTVRVQSESCRCLSFGQPGTNLFNMAPTGVICACCNRSYDAVSMVKCSVCKKTFKNTCVDLSSNEVRTLNANKGYDWSCKHCRTMGNDIKDLKSLILNLQQEIVGLKAELNVNLKSSAIDDEMFENIIQEVNDRNNRKTNIVIFGIPEQSPEVPPEVRIANDKREVKEILHVVDLDLNSTDLDQVRVGKFMPGKSRPIKINVGNERQVATVIRNAKSLKTSRFKQVSLSYDRTPRQLAYFRKVKEELVQRQNNGEDNIRIKYIHNIPKIISTNL